MFLYTVIPIGRGIPVDTVSYYGASELSGGTLVSIPFGKQSILGLVVESTSLISAKLDIKKASFSLKKIKDVIGTSSYTVTLIDAVTRAHKKLLVPKGALAALYLHDVAVEYMTKEVPHTVRTALSFTVPPVAIGTTDERLDLYKRMVRAMFAEKRSVIFVAPTIRQIEWWYEKLSKGIASHSVILHSKKTKKDMRSAWALMRQSERPLLICTTPRYAHVPHDGVGLYVMEDESSTLYKTNDRFEVDMRVCIAALAEACAVPLLSGALTPRFETLITTQTTAIARSYVPDKLVITEVAPYRSVLPTEAVELIRFCQKQKKSLFIYTNRKGLAPLARCSDCGTIVECPTCTLPMVLRHRLVQGEKIRQYNCSHCGDTREATHLCSYCNGWNINTVSVGTESIYEALLDWVPKEHLCIVDDTLTPDSKEIETLIAHAKSKKGIVYIGTQKILPYIDTVDYTLIPFFDRIISVPSPYTVEETLRLIMECNERTRERLVICTRHPEFPITVQLGSQKIQTLIDDDVSARRALQYPPFGVLLKITCTTNAHSYSHVIDAVTTYFSQYEHTHTPPRRISPESPKVVFTLIASVPLSYSEEVGHEMLDFLQSLKVPYKLEINPARL